MSLDLAQRQVSSVAWSGAGAYSQRAARRVGFDPVVRVEYRWYRFDGRAVFASIPAPHVELMLLERIL